METENQQRSLVMTYQDPRIPQPSPGSNPLRYQRDSAMSAGWIAGAIVAVLVLVGVIFYAMSDHSTSTVSNPPASTSGQGTAVNPGAQQNMPNPAPPAPNSTPAERQ